MVSSCLTTKTIYGMATGGGCAIYFQWALERAATASGFCYQEKDSHALVRPPHIITLAFRACLLNKRCRDALRSQRAAMNCIFSPGFWVSHDRYELMLSPCTYLSCEPGTMSRKEALLIRLLRTSLSQSWLHGCSQRWTKIATRHLLLARYWISTLE